MRSLTGLLLMLLGLGLGAHAYYPDTLEKHVHIAKVARILTPSSQSSPEARAVETAASRFSPGPHLALSDQSGHVTDVKTVTPPASPILNSAPKIVRSNGWETTVVRRPAAVQDGRSRALDGRELSGAERWRLVRDIQTQLRRVGCYGGRLDGSWGAGSKYAIRAFLQNVNSALPTDQPDQFMLQLLRAQQGVVCGRPCRNGYTKSSNGRCLPYAITARNRQSEDGLGGPTTRLVRDDGRLAAVDGQQPANSGGWRQRPPLEGRMAVGGLVTGSASARYPAPGVSAEPSLTQSDPAPLVGAQPAERPRLRKPERTRKRYRPRAVSKQKAKRKARRYSSKARQRARRRALVRQAFGDGFD